nr:hypothetical protein [Tanacetum cinerariifolium]
MQKTVHRAFHGLEKTWTIGLSVRRIQRIAGELSTLRVDPRLTPWGELTSWSQTHTLGRANGVLSYFQLGDEGLCSGGTMLNSIFITAESSRTCQEAQRKKYPKRWTKCSKGSEPSLGEKWSLDQQKWSVLLKETKDTFVWHGLEDLKEPEAGVAQGKHEGIWGCTLLILEKILSPRLPRL